MPVGTDMDSVDGASEVHDSSPWAPGAIGAAVQVAELELAVPVTIVAASGHSSIRTQSDGLVIVKPWIVAVRENGSRRPPGISDGPPRRRARAVRWLSSSCSYFSWSPLAPITPASYRESRRPTSSTPQEIVR